MTHRTTPQPARRLVLVPAPSSGRGDELVRRYRLARLRLAGREARVTDSSRDARPRAVP